MDHQHVWIDRNRLTNELGMDRNADALKKLFEIVTSFRLSRIPKSNIKSPDVQLSKISSPIDSPFRKEGARDKREDIATNLPRGEEDAPIPPGYRSVAWIRPYEAQAIKHCFKSQADHKVFDSNGEVTLECNFFPNDAFEVRKFKSNVQVVRINGENRRVIGWIRLEEASAIIQANETRRDVEFSHIRAGRGGLIQFFPEHLEVSRKYRSTTRLLRKD